MSKELRLQREQIHRFVGNDPDAIRVIERLIRGYNTLVNDSIAYDSKKAYAVGQHAVEKDVIYKSLISDNQGNLPSTSPTAWDPL